MSEGPVTQDLGAAPAPAPPPALGVAAEEIPRVEQCRC